MSSSGRGREAARTGKGRREGGDLSLTHVVLFLRVISVMTGALLLVSVLSFALGQKTPAGNVVYALTILCNAIACGGSGLGAWWLDRKDAEITARELQKKTQQLQKGALRHDHPTYDQQGEPGGKGAV